MADIRYADRLLVLKNSSSIAVAEKAAALKKQGKEVIDLSWGEPDIKTPENIVNAGIEALKKGYTRYTNSRGILELREAIANKLKNENGVSYDPNTEIFVTPGGKQAILYALLAFINKGDEVLLIDPSWLSYEDMVNLCEGVAVPVPTKPEENFKIHISEIKKRITPKTRAIIINNPCNPTGMAIDRSELEELAKIAMEHNIFVISDEIYEKILFDGRKFTSMAEINGMRERTILINGFSKSYAMTGLRIAYIAAPKNIVSNMIKLQQHSASSAASVSQYMALEALTGPQDFLPKLNKLYETRRDYFDAKIKNVPGFSWIRPQGTFYGMLNTSKFAKNSLEASNILLDRFCIATVPGAAFGASGENHIRVCLIIENNIMDKVFECLRQL
ncbi:MAG TPA: pyridoxal phosphate-dependent aminotransferase [Candidatus Wallbacteria bacterium]|nr:pyridoxal phosphate-dependent aminotransferase [Candidatus Wallbacteria bacterium]